MLLGGVGLPDGIDLKMRLTAVVMESVRYLRRGGHCLCGVLGEISMGVTPAEMASFGFSWHGVHRPFAPFGAEDVKWV